MEADKKQFLVLLRLLELNYDKPFTKEKAKFYYDFLKEYPIEKLNIAFKKVIEKHDFLTLSKILKELNEDPKASLDYWPEFKEIEQIENVIPKEEAKALVSVIYDKLDKKRDEKNAERQKRFDERKKLLEDQKKILEVS